MSLTRDATGVLIANWAGGHTVPSRTLYPHQWSWDSAFVAIGLRHLSARRAQRELESLFGAQWADGRIPHIVFDPTVPEAAYFPGPGFWRSADVPGAPTVATSGLIQPPVHALAAWEVFLADPAEARRRGFLPRLYPRLVAWHRYLTDRRGTGDAGLVAVVHPWETGMDNSPAWDGPLARIDPAPAGTFRRRDLTNAVAQERPTDVDYGRYVRLATDYRDSGYADRMADREFAVVDPMVNALLACAERALASIAEEIGADPAGHLARAGDLTATLIAELFDPVAGQCFPLDLRTGERIDARTVAGLVPLLIPDLPVAASLVRTAMGRHFRLDSTALLPSYDLAGPAFEPTRYWRGPGWFKSTWLVWRGLLANGEPGPAARLRDTMLTAVRRAGFREYVDPLTGAGCGTGDFSWTAALTLDLVHTGA